MLICLYQDEKISINPVPDWLGDWEKTSVYFASSNDVVFELYKKNVKEGENVILGSNGQSAYCVNYIVLAIDGNEAVKGDVNKDGIFNVADILMMKKYLMGIGTLDDMSAGDLSKDGKIDIFDMILIRRLFIEGGKD